MAGGLGEFYGNDNARQLARLVQRFLPPDIIWRGAFDTTPLVEYAVNNLVFHNNSLWIALVGPLIDAVPGVDPRWDLVIASSSSSGSDPSRARWGGWR